MILQNEINPASISSSDLDESLKYAMEVLKNRFNVDLLPVGKNDPFAQLSNLPAPHAALFTSGGIGALKEEFEGAGDFFSANLIFPMYPITAFIVIDMKNATGCSLGPLTDYVTISHEGIRNKTVLAHELAHACGLWHINDKRNLLWNKGSRGDTVTWWQRNIFRSSRHVTYW